MSFHKKETEKIELVVRPGMYNMEVLVSTVAEACEEKGGWQKHYMKAAMYCYTTKYKTAFTV